MNAILCQDLAREIISLRKELHALFFSSAISGGNYYTLKDKS